MKTSESAEELPGSVHEGTEPRASQPATYADSSDPHGVDGSDELEAAVGKSFGGVLAAGGIFGAVDDWIAGDQEKGEAGEWSRSNEERC